LVDRIRCFTVEELERLDVGSLRAILHERTHHGIEVVIYRVLKGKMEKPPNLGEEAKVLFRIWEKRGLPTDTPDIDWVKKNIEMAERLNAGESFETGVETPKSFSEGEMATVRKLLYGRRSIRQFRNEPVPDWMIEKILYAGLMSPQGCNVDSRRFIVLRDPEKWKLVQSDIPLDYGVMIIVCQDMKVYQALKFDKAAPQNIFFDAATAADHICLMAHALGLGACWLTHGESTQKRIRDYYKLPETFVTRCHIIVGWPDESPIKSQRMSLKEAIIVNE